MKLRNKIGQWRQAEIWDKRFKMSPKVIYAVVLMYAFYGMYSVATTLNNEGSKLINEITHAKTVVISRTDDSETEDGNADDTDDSERIESKDVFTCNEAAEKWGEVYQINPELLKKIIKAESGNTNTAANPDSTARGCSQWIIGSWEYYGKKLWNDEFYSKNIYNPDHNVELMTWTISQYGTADWDASRQVWGK